VTPLEELVPKGLPIQPQTHGQAVARETFIALRARREAYRVATDIQYHRPLDVRHIECPSCHSTIEPPPGDSQEAACGACGQRVPLPSYLRLRPVRTLTPDEVARSEEDVRMTLYAEAEAARQERYVLRVYLILGSAAVILFFVVAYYLGVGAAMPKGF
jgi:hypothetical protein